MKYIISILFMLPLLANAIELVKFQSDPENSSRQKFILNKENIIFKKESNLFDIKKDYSLGLFEAKDKSDVDINARLLKILEKIKTTDEALKIRGLSFNELSNPSDHHQVMMMLDTYKISKNSNFYQELDLIFKELHSKKFVHTKGIELSSDLKTINFFENSKKIKSEEFNVKFSCKTESLPTVCRIKGEGFLFLE